MPFGKSLKTITTADRFGSFQGQQARTYCFGPSSLFLSLGVQVDNNNKLQQVKKKEGK
jgi:hypothetical protein